MTPTTNAEHHPDGTVTVREDENDDAWITADLTVSDEDAAFTARSNEPAGWLQSDTGVALDEMQ